MPSSSKHLLSDKWPVLPLVLSVVVVMAPAYLVFLPAWYNEVAKRTDDDMVIIHAMPVVLVVLYYAALAWTMRGRVKIWWLLPVRPEDIGRVLWWQMVGFPAILFLIGMIANTAAVFPLIHNYGYLDLAAQQYCLMMTISVNWAAWTMLHAGRFRFRSPRRLKGDELFNRGCHWAGVGFCLIALLLWEISWLNQGFRPIPTIFVALPLCLTALTLYAFPWLPVWFNALTEEKAGSNQAQAVRAIAPAALSLGILGGLGHMIFRIGLNLWKWATSTTTAYEILRKLLAEIGEIVNFWIIFGLAIGLTWVGYRMWRARSVSIVLPELEEVLDSWKRRGRTGLFNVTPFLFWMIIFLGLIAWRGSHASELGLLVACFAALLPFVGLHAEKRALAGLPIDPAALTGTLHGATAVISAIPLLPALGIALSRWTDLNTTVALWLLGAAVGQVSVPFRMNQAGVPVPVRWGTYGMMLVWVLLVARATLFGAPYTAAMQANSDTGTGNALSFVATIAAGVDAWAVPLSVAIAVLFTVVAVYRTFMDLTRDAGVRFASEAVAWHGGGA